MPLSIQRLAGSFRLARQASQRSQMPFERWLDGSHTIKHQTPIYMDATTGTHPVVMLAEKE